MMIYNFGYGKGQDAGLVNGLHLCRLLKNSFKYGLKPFAVIPVKTGIQSFQYVTGYPLSRV